MSSYLNILFSTTRQWNPGDEFILFGVRRLLDQLEIKYNPIIYNRHPSITPQKFTRARRWSRSQSVPHLDNSFSLDEDGLIDYVVFAGSPEWFGGPRINPVLEYILRNQIRCAILGGGVHRRHKFSENLNRVARNHADIITARDPLCYELIAEFPNAYYRPCPALFSAPSPRPRAELNKIAVVIQASKTIHHAIEDQSLAQHYLEQFARLEKSYEVTYIAHYIDDFKMGRAMGKEVLYSGYAEDYPPMFDRFDLVVSSRVHGCGLASSLGIPNVLIAHDGRFQTALKFRSHILEGKADLYNLVKTIDVKDESEKLIQYRSEEEAAFLSLLKQHLSIV